MAGRDNPASEPGYVMCPCCGRKVALPYNKYFPRKYEAKEEIGSTVRINKKYRGKIEREMDGDRLCFCAWCWSMFDNITGKTYRFGQDLIVPIIYTATKIEDAHGIKHCKKYMEEQDRLWREGKQ